MAEPAPQDGPPEYRIAVVHLLSNRLNTWVDPTLYLNACGEILAVLIAIGWLLSITISPDAIVSNPLNARLGYYSLCVGFDAWPANLVALMLYVPTAYLGMRFVWTDTMRADLDRDRLTPKQYWFTYWSNALYAASLAVFALVFMENPFSHPYAHTIIFVQLIWCRYIVVAANFYEAPELTTGSRVFFAVYTIISVFTPLLFMVAFVSYDLTGAVLVPWPITASFDYGWFVCLALTTKYLPAGPRIRAEWSLETT